MTLYHIVNKISVSCGLRLLSVPLPPLKSDKKRACPEPCKLLSQSCPLHNNSEPPLDIVLPIGQGVSRGSCKLAPQIPLLRYEVNIYPDIFKVIFVIMLLDYWKVVGYIITKSMSRNYFIAITFPLRNFFKFSVSFYFLLLCLRMCAFSLMVDFKLIEKRAASDSDSSVYHQNHLNVH